MFFFESGDQKYAQAQCSLGDCYYSGQGVTKDKSEAAKWYRKAADQNYAEGQCSLGACYAKGQGVPKDYVLAYEWQMLAAAQGVEEAKKGLTTLKSRMTQEQIVEGQRLARDFKPQVTTSAGDLR